MRIRRIQLDPLRDSIGIHLYIQHEGVQLYTHLWIAEPGIFPTLREKAIYDLLNEIYELDTWYPMEFMDIEYTLLETTIVARKEQYEQEQLRWMAESGLMHLS